MSKHYVLKAIECLEMAQATTNTERETWLVIAKEWASLAREGTANAQRTVGGRISGQGQGTGAAFDNAGSQKALGAACG
jgi:hypothetical protein